MRNQYRGEQRIRIVQNKDNQVMKDKQILHERNHVKIAISLIHKGGLSEQHS